MQILIGESRFDVWFTERQFGCTPVQAKTFIRIAERRQVLRQNFKATLLGLPDLVEHGTRADGDQRRLPQVACTWLSAIMRAQESLNQAVEKSPLEGLGRAALSHARGQPATTGRAVPQSGGAMRRLDKSQEHLAASELLFACSKAQLLLSNSPALFEAPRQTATCGPLPEKRWPSFAVHCTSSSQAARHSERRHHTLTSSNG